MTNDKTNPTDETQGVALRSGRVILLLELRHSFDFRHSCIVSFVT